MNQTIKSLAKRLGFGSKEQKAYALTDPLASSIFGIVPTVSGANVTANSALRVPAVLQAVRLISENCGSTPVKVYEDADSGKSAAKEHPAYRIVHRAANEWTSAVEFRTQLTLDALLFGGGFGRVVRFGDGRPFELHRIAPQKVSVLGDTITGAPVYRVTDQGRSVDYSYSEILHLPAFGGVSPITLGQEAIGIAMILEREMARYFGSGSLPKSVIKFEKAVAQGPEGENTYKNILASYASTFGSGTTNTPMILPPNADLKPLSLSSSDSQFLGHRIEQVNEIARIFGVPPHLLFELNRATWSNAEQMAGSFLQLCLRPWLDRWQDAYNRVLFDEDQRDTHYCEFVIDDLQRADSGGRADIFSKLIASRVMTPNEARATMNLAPRPGGDELANPFTTTNPTPANDNDPAQDQAA
jgi:HK97 family phage portal protein